MFCCHYRLDAAVCELAPRLAKHIAVSLLALGMTMAATNVRADELVVPVGGVVDGEINGQRVEFLVQADGSNVPVVNPDVATRFGLKTGLIGIGARVLVGSVPVNGKTGVFRLTVEGAGAKRRGAWFERPITGSGDGMLGPGAVVQDIATFQLRAPRADEVVLTFPLVDRGYAGMGIQLGNIFIQFDPLAETSIATASAAVEIAGQHEGVFVGTTTSRAMRFGVVRPVRTVHLGSPLNFGGLALSSFLARTQDYGDARGIPDGDSDEIVVTAEKRHASGQYLTLHVGADVLASCSSLSFNKVRKVVSLHCVAKP